MPMVLNRRTLLTGCSVLALHPVGNGVFASGGKDDHPTIRAVPAPLADVELLPSIFATAQAANRAYLASLDPERLLHNFYQSAALIPPKPTYGGWEAKGIAGHSLGHWISGVSLIIANGGDDALSAQLDHCLTEMARIQAAHDDGYIGGTTVDRDGQTVDGKIIFEEVRNGDISSHGFDLNGGWVPIYTWHKVQAGLIDAVRMAKNERAMPILVAMASYLADIIDALDDAQLQRVLSAEHGGLQESYADLFAITGDKRWLRLAERLYHRAVLDPIMAGQDRLGGLHANTQIPKVIGLARLYELTGDPAKKGAAHFFLNRVRDHHSYVIGGNSEREHFGEPDRRANRMTEATCEACNSYNMLKLTRHIYGWLPDARLFDYYERVQINHIMAHQRPDDGRFVYFMPMASGARRIYSEPEDSFWCCVGSGMESHAKHADSIYWATGDTLFVNLYIPSRLNWRARGMALTMESAMPFSGGNRITIDRDAAAPFTIALRTPQWADQFSITVNGQRHDAPVSDGYARLHRQWRKGDNVAVDFTMTLRIEGVPDDPSIKAFLHGPLVLAADMGAADDDGAGPGPVLLDTTELRRADDGDTLYRSFDALGRELQFQPFFNAYDRRCAIYFPSFSAAEWARKKDEYVRRHLVDQSLARRTIDIVYLGEMQPERDHGFVPGRSEVVNWNGRSARRVPPDTRISFAMKGAPVAAMVQILVWNTDTERRFKVTMNGTALTGDWPTPGANDGFAAIQFPLPPTIMEQGSETLQVEIIALTEQALLYEIRLLSSDHP